MLAISGPQGGRFATADVDLDALAAAYGYRLTSAAARERAVAAVNDLAPGSRALDVGGGPGTHAVTWADSDLAAVVLDPSTSMTTEAGRLAGVTAVRGVAQAMPFRSDSFGLAYFHLSIHYGDWRRALDEAERVVGEPGRIVVWTLGSRHHDSSYFSRWFPSVPELDRARFPEPRDLAVFLAERGFVVSRQSDDERVRRHAGEWLAAVRAGFVSTLQLLSAEELGEGIASFESLHPDPEERIDYFIRFDAVVADR